MELGEKIRTARLEAGLSQRQLCGDTITRNMLSQIENGTARPSMATLRVLAARLHKTVGYFLEEAVSCNQALMEQVRQAQHQQVPALLQDYVGPDPVFDRERYYLESNAYLALAKQAAAEGKGPYALSLLEKSRQAGENTPYYDPLPGLLLAYELEPAKARRLCEALPDESPVTLLRAHGAVQEGKWTLALAYLDTLQEKSGQAWHLEGEARYGLGQYAQAIDAYLKSGIEAYAQLESCYKELGDYEKAYFYACLRR